MRKFVVFIILLSLSFLFQSCILCDDCGGEPPIYVNPYTPVIIDRVTFENSVETQSAKSIINSGKIYIKDDLTFINEKNEGFHVYRYTDPENPVNIGFIKILGATDLAVRDGNIYINQAVDLVTLMYNESDNTITVKHRNRNVFPQKNAPNGASGYVGENEIIINWIPN